MTMGALNFQGAQASMPNPKGVKKARFKKVILAISGLSIAAVLGTTFAANININTGNSFEFGQGVAQATACTGADFVIVTPISTYINAAGASGAHYLSDVQISHIPISCENSDFLISVFGNLDILPLDGTSQIGRVPYVGEGTSDVYSGVIGTNIFQGQITSVIGGETYGQFNLHLLGAPPLASEVLKITVQTQPGSKIYAVDTPLKQCVSNLQGEFTKSQIIAILGFSSIAKVQAAADRNDLLFHIAGYDGVPASGYMLPGQDASGTQELFCGNSQDNYVHTMDSDSDHQNPRIWRKDVFLGGAGNDHLDHMWGAVFYGGPGNDTFGYTDEGGNEIYAAVQG
jgi:hypothetical protein